MCLKSFIQSERLAGRYYSTSLHPRQHVYGLAERTLFEEAPQLVWYEHSCQSGAAVLTLSHPKISGSR